MQYGGFWIRLAAYMIDTVVLMIPQYLLRFFYFSTVPVRSYVEYQTHNFIFAFFVALPLSWVYFAYLTSSPWQATIGKRALGLVVTDYSGHRLTFGRATGRFFAKGLSGLILGIGFFMVGWTKRKQGLHDILAETLVIKIDRRQNPAIRP